MPCSWEYGHKQVLVAILHVETTTVAWSFGLRNLQIPGGHHPIGLTGMPFDHARNQACEYAIQNGFKHLFFLDSDVVPPSDTIPRLLARRQPFISGIYARRSPPCALPVMLRGGQWITEYPADALIDVELVGAGCLLLSCDLLRSLPPQRPGHHWFDWRVHLRGIMPPEECKSEDFTWCDHVRKLGHKVVVDTGIVCRHIGFAQATPGQFVPLETTPNT